MPSNTFTFLHSTLIAAVVLVWFATWLTQRRAQLKSHRTIRRLLADRRLLEARLVAFKNGRNEARGVARKLSANSRRLAAKLEQLEAEHARLAVAYSNLEAGLRPQTSQAALLANLADADPDDWFSFPTIIAAPRERAPTGDLPTMRSIGEGWSNYPPEISQGDLEGNHRLAAGPCRPCESEAEIAVGDPNVERLGQCLDSQDAEIRRLRHQVAQLVERERSLLERRRDFTSDSGVLVDIVFPDVTEESASAFVLPSVNRVPDAAPPGSSTSTPLPPSTLLLSMSPTPVGLTSRYENPIGRDAPLPAGEDDALPADSFLADGPFSGASAGCGTAVQAGGQVVRTRREPWVAMGSVVAMLGDGGESGAPGSFAESGFADAPEVPSRSDEPGAIVAGALDGITSVAPRRYAEMPAEVDNLKRIRGIGPVLERMLNRLGVYQYRQIARWSADDIAWFDSELQDFRGRIKRDGWVASAAVEEKRKYPLRSRMH